MKTYRTALVGTGAIAKAHIEALQSEPERIEVIAAVDVNAANLENFCQTYNIPHAYTDMLAMLDEQKPEFVVICTPPATHFELCTQALRHGAHVLCEKPFVASLHEIDQLQATEQETGLTCSIVFQWRFGSAVQHVKRLIDNRELGRPLVGMCNTTWYRDHEYYRVPWRGKWDTELGGVTMGHGIHAMDMFLWLMGDWVEVNGIIATLDRNIEVEDVSMAHVRFAHGGLGSIVNSALSPRQVSYVRMDFQHATIELEHLYRHGNEHWRFSIPEGAGFGAGTDYTDKLAAWQVIAGERYADHAAVVTDVLDALEAGKLPLTTGFQARNTTDFLTSLYKSALTRQPIQRGSIQPDDPFYYHIYGKQKPTRDLRLSGG